MKDMNLKEEIQSISSKNYELTIDLASSSIFLFFFHLAVSYVNPSPALEFLNFLGVRALLSYNQVNVLRQTDAGGGGGMEKIRKLVGLV